MTTKIIPNASSYKNSSGKWMPSGVVIVRDSNTNIEIEKTFKSNKTTKKEADKYFNKKTREEILLSLA